MKNSLFSLFLALIFSGCLKNVNHKENCINYIDSLRIELNDTNLQIAFIEPKLEHSVRPFAFIYDDHLIVLNKADLFYAFTSDCFERDTIFEEKLNSMNFKRAFILENSLYGIDKNKIAFSYDPSKEKWGKTEKNLPFSNETPVYEDERYICYSVSHGEFGGAVFFYNKISHQITFFPTNNVVCVMKKKKGYYIISNLAHMIGGSSVVGINNPDSLFKYPSKLYINGDWKNIREQQIYELIENDTLIESQFSIDFRGSEKLISSGFILRDNYYFLTQYLNKKEKTYLTKFKYDSIGNISKNEISWELPSSSPHNDNEYFVFRDDELDTISVANIIFHDLPASHGEITTKANETTIINYTYFSRDNENAHEYFYQNLLVTTFIQRDSSLIRIDWPKKIR